MCAPYATACPRPWRCRPGGRRHDRRSGPASPPSTHAGTATSHGHGAWRRCGHGRATAGGSHAADGADAGEVTDSPGPCIRSVRERCCISPIPEQLARTELPVFVQIRSSAPIDHVSLFYRGVGARRYTELRMTPMGQQFRLAVGLRRADPLRRRVPAPGASTTSRPSTRRARPTARAGTATAPVVADRRTKALPCAHAPGAGPAAHLRRPQAGPGTCATRAPPPRPSAAPRDLGEPCQVDNDCRRGLRCGSNHACVFESPR